jgi:hypothetical protein
VPYLLGLLPLATSRRPWTVHWRSDFAASLAQGEEVAVSLLRDERATFRERFEGYAFTRFDGSPVTA